LQEPLRNIVETGRRVLEKTPPELVADIIDRGVALCGGGALLRGLTAADQVPGHPRLPVDKPLTAGGRHRARIEHVNLLRRNLHAYKKTNLSINGFQNGSRF